MTFFVFVKERSGLFLEKRKEGFLFCPLNEDLTGHIEDDKLKNITWLRSNPGIALDWIL